MYHLYKWINIDMPLKGPSLLSEARLQPHGDIDHSQPQALHCGSKAPRAEVEACLARALPNLLLTTCI